MKTSAEFRKEHNAMKQELINLISGNDYHIIFNESAFINNDTEIIGITQGGPIGRTKVILKQGNKQSQVHLDHPCIVTEDLIFILEQIEKSKVTEG